MSRALSDFDDMWERLVAWGFQGSSDPGRPDPAAGAGSIYDMGRADRDGEGDELERAPDADPPLRLTEREWETIDGYVQQLGERYRQTLRTYFYRHRYAPIQRVNEAVRQMCDMEQATANVHSHIRRLRA